MSDVFKKYSIQFTYLCSNTAAIEQERGGGSWRGRGSGGKRSLVATTAIVVLPDVPATVCKRAPTVDKNALHIIKIITHLHDSSHNIPYHTVPSPSRSVFLLSSSSWSVQRKLSTEKSQDQSIFVSFSGIIAWRILLASSTKMSVPPKTNTVPIQW